MSKVLPQEIKDLQFFAEQFGSPADFEAFLQGIIDTQEGQLSGLIGVSTFDSVTASIVARVKQAAISLVAVELFRRRINRLSGNADADTAAIIAVLQKAKKEYQADADAVIGLLSSPSPDAAMSDGFSSGVTISDPFGVT